VPYEENYLKVINDYKDILPKIGIKVFLVNSGPFPQSDDVITVLFEAGKDFIISS